MTQPPTHTALDTSVAAAETVFDPYDLELRRDPYPFYRRFLEENPVHRTADSEAWVVSRHEDVSLVLRDARFAAAAPPNAAQARWEALAELGLDPDFGNQAGGESMLFKDPPDHTRMRKLSWPAFTPRAVEALRPKIRRFVDELLDEFSSGDRIDVIGDMAYPLPIMVICEMLAIPESDRPRFKELSRDLAGIVDIPLSPEIMLRGIAAAREFTDYFRELLPHRRRQPGDDVISSLATTEGPEGLSENELLATCVQLLFGGHETTQNLIGNGMLALLRHRDAFEQLRNEPSLLPSAVEELLRYDSPGQLAGRWVAEALELGGHTLRPGERVIALMAAANRDPHVFAEPDRLDITRQPNPHLSFGFGIHFCLGAPLARVEGQEAIGALVDRFPDLELEDQEPEWRQTLALRGLASLPVRF